MDIEYFNLVKYSTTQNRYLLEAPSHVYKTDIQLYQYTVQKGEEMRLDLIMQSMYNDDSGLYYKYADIILYINGIDNPLNIKQDQVLLYPDSGNLTEFRYSDLSGINKGKAVRLALSIPNKRTRKDNNRSKFLESNYSLPPTVLSESSPSVKITENKISIGGLKK